MRYLECVVATPSTTPTAAANSKIVHRLNAEKKRPMMSFGVEQEKNPINLV